MFKNLREWRKSKDLTQEQAADLLGVQRATYQTYESGRSEPPMDFRKRAKKEGYDGPWEAGEGSGGSLGAPATAEAVAALSGRVQRLEEDSRAVLPLIQAVRDLDARVRELEKRLERSE